MSRYRGPARGHVRPMAGWWRRNPFFVRYMLREASAVVLLAYALVLLTGLAALVHGDAAFDTWRKGLATPLSLLLHALGLPLLGYHSWTWFQVMPKTLPRLPVPARAATLGALLLAAALSAVILVLVAGAGR